jgi:argininosuccinate lyase
LAYCEKFERDRQRLVDCRRRANVCPLGTAAVAGTSLQIDRQQVAEELGFDGPSANSLDASSDRDFVVEFAFALSLIACHLSSLAEEWILWSTAEFGFIQLPQQFCTGSSIMPQKINPDVLELIRAKSARAIGNLQTLLVLIKGLPLAYNRDLQEDKPPLFDSFDQVLASCQLLAPMVREMQWRNESIRQRLEDGYLDATTMMEYFIKRGTPQRAAHQLVGTIVRHAMDRKISLSKLSMEDLQTIGVDCDQSIFEVLGVDNAIKAFVSYGSTAKAQVENQLNRWKALLTDAYDPA